jgi:ubiquinone/menaquinone biosynthesis C-methylase UbiE
MGWYEEQILPRFINIACGVKANRKLRQRLCAGLEGTVLEIGFGSGHNLPYYPTTVTKLYAIDPSHVGRRLAADRLASSPVSVEFVGLDGEKIPLEDESVDHVVSTWTLCTIPDAGQAMEEVRRVLRASGVFHFLEHGLAPDPRVVRWQSRLNPLQQKVAGGCNLNRPIADLVGGSGLEVDGIDNFYMPGPKPLVYQYEGTARKV